MHRASHKWLQMQYLHILSVTAQPNDGSTGWAFQFKYLCFLFLFWFFKLISNHQDFHQRHIKFKAMLLDSAESDRFLAQIGQNRWLTGLEAESITDSTFFSQVRPKLVFDWVRFDSDKPDHANFVLTDRPNPQNKKEKLKILNPKAFQT